MNEGATRFLAVGQVVILALAGGLFVQGSETRRLAEEAATKAAAAEKAAKETADAMADLTSAVASLADDLDMLSSNVGAVERNLAKLAEDVLWKQSGFETGTDVSGADAPPGQPVIEFSPELKASLRDAVAKKGVELMDDRVVIPGEIILRQGNLEFFAVFPGGKAHESILVLTGTPGVDEDGDTVPQQGLAAALNSCLMALGLKPGTPLRVLPGGRVLPSTGTPVHIAVEWEEDGALVRVRAEDMLWDNERSRTLEPGKFLYVGSFFEPEGYVPDLTGDAVAVYSVPTCVIDLSDPRAATDTIFLACAPRIPEERTKVRVVFSPEPLEPTRTWDPEKPSLRTDPGAPPPEAGGEGTDGGGGAGGGK